MTFSEVKQQILRDFLFCVQNNKVPPLRQYFPDYVTSPGGISPDHYCLLPITGGVLGCLTTSSDCLTDCMIELQGDYKEYIVDEWGGHTERGWREVGVIGFNVLEGIVLDILAIEKTTRCLDWAGPKLDCINWERILMHAVVDFGRYCKAKQVRLQPAHQCPPSAEIKSNPARLDEFQKGLRRRHDDNARAFGFDYEKALDRFVFDL